MKIVDSHFPIATTRCDFLARAAKGFGSLALSYLLARDAKAQDGGPDRKLFNPLAPKQPHFPAKAKKAEAAAKMRPSMRIKSVFKKDDY
jgi:hypothetical protein